MTKVKFYKLYDGDPKPHTITMDVKNEYHLMNILPGFLIIAEDLSGKVPDKVFCFYEGTWYWAHHEPSEKTPDELPDGDED